MNRSVHSGQKRPVSTLVLALVPIAIVVNIVAGQLVAALRLPLYLDSIGTIMVGVLAGPLAGALTGALSNIIWGLIAAPVAIPFAITAAAIGALAGLFGRRGWFRSFPRVLMAGAIIGISAAIISTPIATYLFGGITGGGTDALVAVFQSIGASILEATFYQSLLSDSADKLLSVLVAWLVLKSLPGRLLVRFPQGDSVRNDTAEETA